MKLIWADVSFIAVESSSVQLPRNFIPPHMQSNCSPCCLSSTNHHTRVSFWYRNCRASRSDRKLIKSTNRRKHTFSSGNTSESITEVSLSRNPFKLFSFSMMLAFTYVLYIESYWRVSSASLVSLSASGSGPGVNNYLLPLCFAVCLLGVRPTVIFFLEDLWVVLPGFFLVVLGGWLLFTEVDMIRAEMFSAA